MVEAEIDEQLVMDEESQQTEDVNNDIDQTQCANEDAASSDDWKQENKKYRMMLVLNSFNLKYLFRAVIG